MTDVIITTEADGGRTTGAPPSATVRRDWAWLGLVPFFAFLFLFLIVPAVSVFSKAFKTEDSGFSLSAMGEAFSGQNFQAFKFSIVFSAGAAIVGVVLGTILAYAAASLIRPEVAAQPRSPRSAVSPPTWAVCRWRSRSSRCSAPAPACSPTSSSGSGLDIYDHGFDLGNTAGLIVVYSYFNIPLMVLITLPAIDGLKQSWREACANLGGTTFTYWRRVGLPVLMPSLLGGFLLLFANSFAAYATARILTDNSKIVSLRIAFFLGGDVGIGEDAVGFSLAAWMIIIMAVSMSFYWLARKRAERWRA